MYIYPCKGCSSRTEDCHGKCERYLAAREEHRRLRQEVLKVKAADDIFVEYKARIVYETRRRFEGRK